MPIFSFYKKNTWIKFHYIFLLRNLTKRAENCVDTKINHIFFNNESLVFQFAKSKGHQNVEKYVGPYNVYATPHKPHLCYDLSLARYIFTYPQLIMEGNTLFEWKNQYARYAELFMKLVKESMDDMNTMGMI